MPLKNIEVPREKVDELVEDSKEAEGLELSKKEEAILNEVLDTFPEKISPIGVFRWCQNKVDKILEKYPEFQSRAEVLRGRARKEILFHLYEDKFAVIKDAIEEEDPDEISPAWIRSRKPSLASLIKKSFRTNDDKIDWKFITDKLGVEDKFTIQEHTLRDEKKAILDLKHILEEEKPKNFSPKWIEDHNDSLHSHIRNRYKNEKGLPDWLRLVSQLDKKWHKKWEYKEAERGRTLVDNIKDVKEELKDAELESISPDWIFKNVPKAHYFMQKHIRNIDGKIDWQVLVDTLPKEWQEKWDYAEKRSWTFSKAADHLKALLESSEPETFNGQWIKSIDQGLYLYFLRNVRADDGDGINWNKVIAPLPSIWQERWRAGMRDEKKRELSERRTKWVFETAMQRLNEILREDNPEVVRSSYIGEKDASLLSFFVRHIKNNENEVDWDRIIAQIDEEFSSRFVKPKKLSEHLPEKSYENAEEVDEILMQNQDKMYTLFEQIEPEDLEARNKIINEFIKIIQEGNVSARDRLTDLLEVYKYYPDVAKTRLRRCIYFFNPNQKEPPFIGYLYNSLASEAKGLSIPKFVEQDKPYSDSESLGQRFVAD